MHLEYEGVSLMYRNRLHVPQENIVFCFDGAVFVFWHAVYACWPRGGHMLF